LALVAFGAAARGADPFTDRLEPVVRRVVEHQSLPGIAVGVVAEGRVVYAKGFGLARLGSPDGPVTPETLFHMASVTKTFTAVAVLQLVERGRVDLDAPVVRYVPYFRLADERYRAITVRQMLTHTSGMPDAWDWGWDRPETDDGALGRYVRSLGGATLLTEPGARFSYNNNGYEVLGCLVAEVSGLTFEEYVRTHLLAPLGMDRSSLLLSDVRGPLLAGGHVLDDAGDPVVSPVYPYNREHTPSSNLHSNVAEMLLWARAHLGRGQAGSKRILDRATYDVLWRPSPAEPSEGTGWFLDRHRGLRVVGHPGGDTGFATDFLLVPEKGIGVVALTNADWVPLRPLTLAAIDVALGLDPPPVVLKREIDMRFYEWMKADGIEAAIGRYRSLKARRRDVYEFEEWRLGSLGRHFLTHGNPKDALEILRFNAEEYPASAVAHRSLGAAWAANGHPREARASYERALALDPGDREAAEGLASLPRPEQLP
jgi:CubicO group peptidase (beta-lactamase class C family)